MPLLEEDCIQFDTDTFCVGDTVTGTVTLDNRQKRHVTAVEISWLGKVYVDRKIYRTPLRGGFVAWQCDTQTSTSDGDGEKLIEKNPMPVGHYKFPFSFQLPANCWPTLDFIRIFSMGCLYTVTVTVKMPGMFRRNETESADFNVVKNPIPSPKTMAFLSSCLSPATTTLTRERYKLLEVQVELRESLFAPGDDTTVALTVLNSSPYNVKGMIVKIVQFDVVKHPASVFGVNTEYSRHKVLWDTKQLKCHVPSKCALTYDIPIYICEEAGSSYETRYTRTYHTLQVTCWTDGFPYLNKVMLIQVESRQTVRLVRENAAKHPVTPNTSRRINRIGLPLLD